MKKASNRPAHHFLLDDRDRFVGRLLFEVFPQLTLRDKRGHATYLQLL